VGLTLSSQLGIFAAMVSSTLLLTALVGLLPTIWLLGLLQLINKCVHVASYAGNRGFVERPWRDLLADSTALYHTGYLLCCLLGLLIHPFIYALLVTFPSILLFFIVLHHLSRLQLFDIIACEETLRNVIRSVTRNWQSIILTGLLACEELYHQGNNYNAKIRAILTNILSS
jgi:inositol 1,4,5-triphosphate receptor type 1